MSKQKEDNANWKFIEISKVDDKIINNIINHLKFDLSEDFYISIESVLKLGKKAELALETQINEMDDYYIFKKELFKLILNYIKTNKIENPYLFDLYHPDFVIRANALRDIERNDALKYLHLIIPIIDDPDDSVRWAVLNLLISLNQINNPIINKKLKNRANIESNQIIKKKLLDVLNLSLLNISKV